MPIAPESGDHVCGKLGEYSIQSIITEGDTAWSLKARRGGDEVFLKYYKSPTPNVSWYENYLAYEQELNHRLNQPETFQFCVLPTDTFCTSPDPDDWNHYLFQAYEYIHADDLSCLLTTALSWEKRKSIAKVFLMAMKKIHAAGVIHCDLKPENVQMVPTSAGMGLIPRIIDMDRSIMVGRTAPWKTGEAYEQEGYSGTPRYFSPEHLRGQCPQTASDVFTIGIILAEILCGKHPYGHLENESARRNAVLHGEHRALELLATLGGSAENARSYAALMTRCLSPAPEERPSCEELHSKLLELDFMLMEDDDFEEGGKEFGHSGSSAGSSETDDSGISKPPPTTKSIPKAAGLRLTGDLGSVDFRISLEIGSQQLGEASSETQYANKRQFRLERAPGDGWFISPCPGTAALTLHNEAELTERTRLQDGDSICLMGRSSGKKAMRLTVHFISVSK